VKINFAVVGINTDNQIRYKLIMTSFLFSENEIFFGWRERWGAGNCAFIFG